MRGRWTWTAILAVAVAACGGSAGPGGASEPGQEPAPTTDAGDPGLLGTSAGDPPVTVTVGGATYGYGVGTCGVAGADDLVADAATEAMSFQHVSVRISEASGASMQAVVPMPGDAPPMQLFAGDPRPDTRWEVSVDGTTAVIEARMVDESPAAGADAFHDVTITIRCAERGFGGMAPPTEEAPPVFEEPAATPVPSEATITLDLGGAVSTFTYLGCPLTEPELGFVVIDATATRLAVVRTDAQVNLADGTQYRASSLAFAGSDASATWTGTLTSAAGDARASITITCG